MASKYQWIMYTAQSIPGGLSFDLDRATSLADAKAKFEKFCRDAWTTDCSATLYAYSDESWAQAQDFRKVGCPFDYPDRLIERGRNGGIKVSRA